MTSTYSKVIADSIANDIRLTTLECYYPLMVHAQAKTHRILSLDDECYIETNYSVGLMDDPMLSRNAQSNRAMPVTKMLEQVVKNPAMPSKWGKNQAGMSAEEENDQPIGGELSREIAWSCAANEAASWSKMFAESQYHKQISNRLTMPFQYIKVIVTATEWDNFFNLRLNDADPTMMELASKMKEAMDNSNPVLLEPGEYHLPYVDLGDFDDSAYPFPEAIKCSVARCARVSYNNHDNSSPNIEKDIALADRLLRDGHMSPFEHQATPMEDYIGASDGGLYPVKFDDWTKGTTHVDKEGKLWSGNFTGWIQYRQTL